MTRPTPRVTAPDESIPALIPELIPGARRTATVANEDRVHKPSQSPRKLAVVILMSLAAMLAWSTAPAQEAQVKRLLESKLGMKVESVAKGPYAGLFEVVSENGGEREIYYTDEKVNYLVSGNIIDVGTRRNLTQERLDKLASIRFDDLPLELAIKQVRGNGKRLVAVFADPYCVFCKRLDQNLVAMDNVTIYTFLYPILRKDESAAMASRIWCSPDRVKAYNDLMLRNRAPSSVAACKAPVDKWLALGNKLGISATPVSYVGSGARIIGARFDELQRLIDEPAPR